jgi:hypothetical protein
MALAPAALVKQDKQISQLLRSLIGRLLPRRHDCAFSALASHESLSRFPAKLSSYPTTNGLTGGSNTRPDNTHSKACLVPTSITIHGFGGLSTSCYKTHVSADAHPYSLDIPMAILTDLKSPPQTCTGMCLALLHLSNCTYTQRVLLSPLSTPPSVTSSRTPLLRRHPGRPPSPISEGAP